MNPSFVLAALACPLIVQAAAPLTLEDAVRVSLAQSPRLRAARFEAQAAQAQTDRDKPVGSPTVSTMAEARVQGPRVVFPRAGSGDDTVVPERYGRVELNIEQTLYRAGIGAARTRYEAQTRANSLEYRRQQNDLALEARRAYFQLLSAQEMTAVAREGVTLARKHLDLTRTMLEAGNASERDVKASDADLAEAEQGAQKAENGAALARANLNRVMGRDPAADLLLVPAFAVPVVPPTLEEGIAAALRQRPEIFALREGIAAARAGTSLAAMQDMPALSGRATAAAQTPTALTSSRYFAAGLVVTWNPFDTARTRADVRESRARVSQLESQLEEAQLGVRLDVEKARRDMREAASRIETAGRQAASAQSALDISELRYEARAGTQLEVSGALFNANKARANQAQARADLQTAYAEYLHAIGSDAAAK